MTAAPGLESAARLRLELRRSLRASEKAAHAYGLTPQRYLLLLAIKANPGESSTVTQLAELMQINQSTTTELVKRAEQAGLVDRTRSDKDRRVSWLTLTDEGERRLAATLELAGDDPRLTAAVTARFAFEDALLALEERGAHEDAERLRKRWADLDGGMPT